MQPAQQWTDRKVEEILGNLLRIGVGVAAVVVLVGAVISLAHHSFEPANYSVFHGALPELRQVRGILRSAMALQGRGIIQLGLLVLIATPIARVAFSIFGFAAEKDRMYLAFTALVLAILLFSLRGLS